MKQNTTPVVKVINGVHTFTNLNPDGDVSMDVEDTKYSGAYFDYDVDHQFTWTLNAMDFFEYAYDYEVVNGI
ncbi:TPA: hypothetical protein LAL36_004347 [Escherichia coli]|nr:hypothetical protein [Escherichia coli]